MPTARFGGHDDRLNPRASGHAHRPGPTAPFVDASLPESLDRCARFTVSDEPNQRARPRRPELGRWAVGGCR
jgi:hypothetical protein